MSAPTSEELLGSSRFNQQHQRAGSGPDAEAPTALGVLGGGTIDPASLHPLAGLVDSKDLDYLLIDDDKIAGTQGGKSVLPNRGFGDELCYGTGTTYLTGLVGGGLWGLTEGIRRPLARVAPAPVPAAAAAAATPEAAAGVGAAARNLAEEAAAAAAANVQRQQAQAAGTSAAAASSRVGMRLRWNAILNSVTRRGTFTGNNAGVLALIYNCFNWSIDTYREKHDIYGSMASGAVTGAIWRSTAGIKRMTVASGLMALGAGAWTKAKVYLL